MSHELSYPTHVGCKKYGFTLIELLVVVAVIALLAAILFPVFARARENARRAACQSNLKQLGLGILQYSQDYDERYPPCWIGMWSQVGPPDSVTIDANGKRTATFKDILGPYLKSSQIWKCPSSGDNAGVRARPSDYGYNYGLLGFDSSGPDDPTNATYTATQSDIRETSRTIMMADIMWAVSETGSVHWAMYNSSAADKDPETWKSYQGNEWISSFLNQNMISLGFPQRIYGPARSWPVFTGDWGPNGYMAYWRHFSRANVLYCDGHVKSKSVIDVYSHQCGDPQSEYCNGN